MTIVSIAGDEGTAPIRIEVGGVISDKSTNFYAGRDTRGLVEKAAKSGIGVTRQIYAEAIEMACTVAEQTSKRLTALVDNQRPDEFEVSFGLSFDSELDAKIVTIDSGAQVQVRMQWNRRCGD